ncbi:dUTP diphosphatase [Acetobacterium woodii]|uniref:Deoxyuridine 5'-triphosphate nucleotidohydrolase n=1 Tax=Acetobacterium woodii (strain ATCC 29683 / DSM 1030 / JCM 2381 / KCTC 1655 / WB1) TaxID=931626 RepID=H6LFT8_ACEWD|nr:dUTP diphosphatase [Acetobacterium woodii]AFA48226.1 deoxyuridine 5'-triphosphate nucleotidohydrolase Dut1 [Acetobacterium woodii DSM 1030]
MNNKIFLKIKKLSDEAVVPKYAHKGDAGMDLFSVEELLLKSGDSELIKTGISIELPENTEAQVRPRSGLALKHGITVLNTPGTIDYEYRGEIGVILINHGKDDYQIQKGDRIAQLVVKPVLVVEIQEVTELSETTRSNSGFGSSGK